MQMADDEEAQGDPGGTAKDHRNIANDNLDTVGQSGAQRSVNDAVRIAESASLGLLKLGSGAAGGIKALGAGGAEATAVINTGNVAVYKSIGANGKVNYAGISEDLISRNQKHIRSGMNRPGIAGGPNS